MVARHKSTRQRLVQAALQLFAAQGVTETTTRQIAELAEVNEVTLFRQFGSKHGLLLAVIEEAEVFTHIGEVLGQQMGQIQGLAEALEVYAEVYLRALEQIPEFVRSLVGEAGHYPPENRQAIGRGLVQIHRYTVQYLTTVVPREHLTGRFEVEKVASLLNTLLLGYAAIEFTTEFHGLWSDRRAFITDLVDFLLPSEQVAVVATTTETLPTQECSLATLAGEVLDLPSPLVRAILQKARRTSLQDYALVYVVFGSGLSAKEIAHLWRSHSIFDEQQHLLQVTQGAKRQVPLNQWILGHRYGSYTKNPLTQWLKTRKDEQPALFINAAGQPISKEEIRLRWKAITEDLITPSGSPPTIEQAQQTWCVEMLMRGINLEGLSILTGCKSEQLQPYADRAHAKAVLEQALKLDRNRDSV